MISEKMYELGSRRSSIRELFEYGKEAAKRVGAENVYDFSLGNPSTPPPAEMTEAAIHIALRRPRLHLGTGSARNKKGNLGKHEKTFRRRN